MKNIKTIATSCLFVLSITSCKKDYTCICNITATGCTETLNYTFKETHKKAKDNCDDYKSGAISSAVAIGFSDASASCTLND